jgi:hypothetical protein
VSSRVRLTKSPERYLGGRDTRRELAYEAMIASGRTSWSPGDRVRVYRTPGGAGRVIEESDEDGRGASDPDPRDYDIEHYARLLGDTFASRLERAFVAEDYAAVFGDPDRPSLFGPHLSTVQPVLTRLSASGRMTPWVGQG